MEKDDMSLNYIKDFQKPLKSFLIMKFFAYSQSAFARFLINIYFWRITGNISFLVLFNVVFYLSHTLTFIFAGKINKEVNRFASLRIGMILQIVYLFLILLIKDRIVEYIIPIAIIGGIAYGAYWSSDNLLKLDLTAPKNRFKSETFYEVLKNTARLLIPLIASILVVTDGGIFHAYSKVFIMALVFAVLVLISSFFISPEKKFKAGKYDLRNTFKKLWSDKNIRIASLAQTFRYIPTSLSVLLGILLFISSGTELSLGGYQSITVLIAIITNLCAGAYFKRKSYKTMLIGGGVVNLILVCILLFSQSYTAIFIYGILSSIFAFTSAPLYPLTLDTFNMCAKNKKECANMRAEFIVLQELFVGSGFIIGFLILLIVKDIHNVWALGLVIIILSLFDLFSRILAAKIKDGKYATIDGMN